MRLRALIAVALLLAGCGTTAPSAEPKLVAVEPAQGTADRDTQVLIRGEALNPAVKSDFGDSSKSKLQDAFTASLVPESGGGDAVQLLDVAAQGTDALSARVPAGMPQGVYDLVVQTPQGKSAQLAGSFRVVTSAEDVDHFAIDPIPAQTAGVPFSVRAVAVDATGRVVDGFTGTATASDTAGKLGQLQVGPFDQGRATFLVELDALVPSDALDVVDALGHRGSSQTFAVTAGPAAALQITSATQQLTAGQCSAPLSFAVLDARGYPALLAASEHVDLAAGPVQRFGFYSDSSCATSISSLDLAAGEGAASVYLRGLSAGSATVRASPADFPAVTQDESVLAAAATTLAVISDAQAVRAGACSSPVSVAAQDDYGNAASTPALALSLAASKSSVDFFSDGACSTPASSISSADGGLAQFTFRAADAGAFSLTVTAGSPATLTSAQQSEDVSP